MPLLITPTTPFATSTGIPVPQVYAIILHVEYDTRERQIQCRVGYFYSEQAYLDKLEQVQCNALQPFFFEAATADEANAVPIFTFLEQVVTRQLAPRLGEGATIENVA